MTTSPGDPRRDLLALAGAAAGLAGIGVSMLLTSLLNARATPVEMVAETVVDLTPGAVVEGVIALVGTWDKPLLLAGVTAAVIALSALAGVLSRRSRLLAQLVLVAMGGVALLAGLAQPGFTAIAVLPLAGGVATWFVALALLVDAAPSPPTPRGRGGGLVVASGPTRRGFLVRVAVVSAGALALAAGSRLFGQGVRAVETARRLLRLPVTDGVVPLEADLGLPGLTPWRVPNEDFYRIDTALVVPLVDPAEWSVRIHGMVEREVTLSYDDLVSRELTEAWVTLCCVSNEVGGDLIGNAWWSGVRVADLLAEAGVSEDADAVLQTSHDGWTCGTPLEALTDGRNALLAVGMNGQPLPVEHGFPVRTVVPGLYGFVSATKWVVDLEVTRFGEFSAYWTEQGWGERGPVKTQSRIEVPRAGADVPAGEVRVGGYAWAQHTGIERVEVRVDGRGWQQADLGGVPGVDTWVQWALVTDLAPGEHTLTVRATDRSGYAQTAAVADVLPDGATGWHTLEVTAS